jgi:predicted nuclease of predicted toxin-antitoxin system
LTCSSLASPEACHVRDHGLSADDDEKIWSLALHEGFFIVTKDNDVLARALVRGHPPQAVQVCVGNASTGQIAAILRDRLDSIEAFVTTATESVFLLRGAEPS